MNLTLTLQNNILGVAGLSPMGGLGGLQPPQFLTDQLTLSQPGGTDYAHLVTTGTSGFSDLPTALSVVFSLRQHDFEETT